MYCDKLFSDKLILLNGDFLQILVVVRKSNRRSIVHASIEKSLRQHCTTYKLEIRMRVQNANVNNTDRVRLISFSTWLLKIGSDDIEPLPGATLNNVVEISNIMFVPQ